MTDDENVLDLFAKVANACDVSFATTADKALEVAIKAFAILIQSQERERCIAAAKKSLGETTEYARHVEVAIRSSSPTQEGGDE